MLVDGVWNCSVGMDPRASQKKIIGSICVHDVACYLGFWVADLAPQHNLSKWASTTSVQAKKVVFVGNNRHTEIF